MSKFGALLAELRRETGITQKDLAKLLHVTPSTISNYEKNVHLPDVEKLIDLADYFHVTIDYMLGRCGSNLPLDIFNETIIDKKTVGELISEIQRLPADRKDVLATILSDMNFRMAVKGYSEKESQ